LAKARTSDLALKRGQWWLQVVGKGAVADHVPLPVDALAAIERYRHSTGRPALPPAGCDEPLLMDIGGACPRRRETGVRVMM
jgi:integrase